MRRCTFSGVERHDRFGGGHKPGGKVTRLPRGARVLQPVRTRTRCWTEDACRDLRPRTSCLALSTSAALVPVRRNRARCTETPRARDAQGQWRNGRLPTRPVLKHGPRSLTCARVTGSIETRRRNESKGGACLPREGKIPCFGAGALPARLYAASSARRSKSAHVGTRKMVNYA